MTTTTATTFPGKFKPGAFMDEPDAPDGYTEPDFDLDLVLRHIKPSGDDNVAILGRILPAVNGGFKFLAQSFCEYFVRRFASERFARTSVHLVLNR
jgi:hypothetical protein